VGALQPLLHNEAVASGYNYSRRSKLLNLTYQT